MKPLFTFRGSVHAWLDDVGRIYDVNGVNRAFIESDSVYDFSGKHIGWWDDGQVRNGRGVIALSTKRLPVKPGALAQPPKTVSAGRIPLLRDKKPVKPEQRDEWTEDHLLWWPFVQKR